MRGAHAKKRWPRRTAGPTYFRRPQDSTQIGQKVHTRLERHPFRAGNPSSQTPASKPAGCGIAWARKLFGSQVEPKPTAESCGIEQLAPHRRRRSLVKRYQPLAPRPVLAIAAAALSASTLALLVVVPSKMEPESTMYLELARADTVPSLSCPRPPDPDCLEPAAAGQSASAPARGHRSGLNCAQSG